MDLLKIASVPAAAVSPDTTVHDAVALMNRKRVGAVAVTESDKLAGIFTERDLMIRVVLDGKDPKATAVAEVMTADCISAKSDMSMGEALQIMSEKHFRHLPRRRRRAQSARAAVDPRSAPPAGRQPQRRARFRRRFLYRGRDRRLSPAAPLQRRTT